jgi:hypothetical protein
MHTQSVPATLGAALACLLALNAHAAGQAGGATSVLSAGSFSFSAEPVGTPSTAQILTLTNTGGADLSIVSIVIVGPDFSQTNTCGNSVAAGATCAITIIFDPIAFGTRTGSMAITSSAGNSPQAVKLAGTGMGPAVSLSTGALSFSSQLVTTTSQPQAVVLSSNGDEPLAISTIILTGPFSDTDTCLSAEVNAGTTCSINVYFTPVAGGTATGSITITDNAYPAVQTIVLSGTGADFALSLSPNSNSTTAGSSAEYTVSVTPTGGFSGTVALGCDGLRAGVGCSFSPDSVTVSGTAAATSTLTVSTTAAGAILPTGRSSPILPIGLRIRPLWPWSLLLLGLGGLVAFRRSRGRWVLGCAAAALLLGALMMPACGGSKSTSTTVTTPGAYSFVVTGTTPAGNNTIQGSASFTLVVK